MDAANERYLELSAAVRALSESNEQTRRLAAELQRQLDMLLQILVGRGELNAEHRAIVERQRAHARLLAAPPIDLAPPVDKYAVANAEVDCAARMHVCHGRCCAFKFSISRQDIEEGELIFDIDRPYRLAKNDEGYCVHQVRETGFCGVYEHRPAVCREYSCADDRRIWVDFEKMIPAPMSEGLVTIRRHVPQGR
jgi:Fe-S-cluster containining protein